MARHHGASRRRALRRSRGIKRRLSALAIAVFAITASTALALHDWGTARAGPVVAANDVDEGNGKGPPSFDRAIVANADAMIDEGRQTFRFDTFGDETFWGDQLQLHRAIEGARFGGVGDGSSGNRSGRNVA